MTSKSENTGHIDLFPDKETEVEYVKRYNQLKGWMYNKLLSGCGKTRWAVAEELVHEAVYTSLKSDKSYNFRPHALYYGCKNSRSKYFRDRKEIPFSSIQAEESLDFIQNIPDPRSDVLHDNQDLVSKVVQILLDHYPTDNQAKTMLLLSEGYSMTEIGKLLCISQQRVSSIVASCRKFLISKLEELGYERR